MMNRKRISQLVAFLVVSSCPLLSAQAAPQDKINVPMVSLLLLSGSENVSVTPCASRGIEGSETVIVEVLEWQRCDDQRTYNWYEAVNYCENLELNEFSDWRLPTKDELKNIVYCSNGKLIPLPDPDPYVGTWNATCAEAIDDVAGVDYSSPTISDEFVCDKQKYWTSTSYVNDENFAWTVDFEKGDAATRSKELTSLSSRRVRCVR